MAKEANMRFTGVVSEVLGNAMFRVTLENEARTRITAYIGGKIRKHEINIANGDRVELEISPYDLTRGRIVYRL